MQKSRILPDCFLDDASSSKTTNNSSNPDSGDSLSNNIPMNTMSGECSSSLCNSVQSTSTMKPLVCMADCDSTLSDETISSSDAPTSNGVAENVIRSLLQNSDHDNQMVVSSSKNTPNNMANSCKRPMCRYSSLCYRKNPEHKAEFSHPGDDDYNEEAECSSSTNADTDKPTCWFGRHCYRKNKDHLEKFCHSFTESGRPKRMTKAQARMDYNSDDSDEQLEDFSDTDEYEASEASFIDDDEEFSDTDDYEGSIIDDDDDMNSEDEALFELSESSDASEKEGGRIKRKKTALRRNKKQKQ